MKNLNKLWLALIIMALLSPLGLYVPELFKATSAWGEWSTEEISKLVGYEPEGMKKTAELWAAPMPDYNIPGSDDAPIAKKSVFYVLSGLSGICICLLLGWMLSKCLVANRSAIRSANRSSS